MQNPLSFILQQTILPPQWWYRVLGSYGPSLFALPLDIPRYVTYCPFIPDLPMGIFQNPPCQKQPHKT